MNDDYDGPCRSCGSPVRMVTKQDPRPAVNETFEVRVCTNQACSTNGSRLDRLLNDVP